GNWILRGLLQANFLPRLLDPDGFVDVTPQGRLQCRNFLGRGELYPAARLGVLADLFENVLRVLQQGAFEEGERARFLQRDDDRHVLLPVGEAGLAPFQLLGQAAAECNLPEAVDFLLPLFRVRHLHRSAYLVACSFGINTRRVRRISWHALSSRVATSARSRATPISSVRNDASVLSCAMETSSRSCGVSVMGNSGAAVLVLYPGLVARARGARAQY